MSRYRIFAIAIILLILVFLAPGVSLAQTYSFSVDKEVVNVYWNEDGTLSLDYLYTFNNDVGVSPLDYVDVGMPNENYDISSITAEVNGNPISDIATSPYVQPGIALGLGGNAIQPGDSGQVHVFVGKIQTVLYPDSGDSSYASTKFSPAWFGSEYVHGSTDLTVSFHLPPGVQPEEPRWHEAPSGFPSSPETKIDDQGRVMYTWGNPQARGDTQYLFGASFPAQYVPAAAIVRPGFWETLGISPEDLIPYILCCGFFTFFVGSTGFTIWGASRRKLQYLPPKIAIEGHGIKRGLTAVEAAILLEQPLDKILTMILFSAIKKEAASVTTRDPLKIKTTDPLPAGLQPYEEKFLSAFSKEKPPERQNTMQEMMIDLVKEVSQKMKGFSRRESITYYKEIMNRAWAQVEAADTPEVKSQKFEEALEWTMLDNDYDDRTKRVFREGPVFVPIWWPRYDPTFHPGPTLTPVSTAGVGGKGLSMPHLPGSDFAASMVRGVQGFSSGVVGNITDFTSRITDKTNPVPKTTSSGKSYRSSGGGCACACACAGCACACAGGGR